MVSKSSVDKARLLYYGLLSKFLIYKSDIDRFKDVDDMLSMITTNPINNSVLSATTRLLNVIDTQGYDIFISEYDEIFHSIKHRALVASASHYEDGVEFGKKCIQTKQFLAKTPIRKDEKQYKEPEDNIGFLMIFMYELIKNVTNGNGEYQNTQYCLFKEIINPFVDLFIEDLFEHPASNHYKDVAIIMSAFMDFERLYFEIEKVKPQEIKRKYEGGISPQEAKRRAMNKAKKELDAQNLV